MHSGQPRAPNTLESHVVMSPAQDGRYSRPERWITRGHRLLAGLSRQTGSTLTGVVSAHPHGAETEDSAEDASGKQAMPLAKAEALA